MTLKQQWNSAIRELRALGVHVQANIDACCAGCIDREKDMPWFDDTKPYIAWLKTQGRAIRFYADGSFKPEGAGTWRVHEDTGTRYLNWGNINPQQVVDVFTKNGIDAEPPESEHHAIAVHFPVNYERN